MNWFRWSVYTTRDPKFEVVARKSGQPKSTVIACWTVLLEHASANSPKGSVSGFDVAGAALLLDCTEKSVEEVIAKLKDKQLIAEGHINYGSIFCGFDPDWPLVRSRIMAEREHVCAYCGDRDGPLEVDHIIPRSAGGTNDPVNLTIACKSCNSSKGAKPLDVWLNETGRLC